MRRALLFALQFRYIPIVEMPGSNRRIDVNQSCVWGESIPKAIKFDVRNGRSFILGVQNEPMELYANKLLEAAKDPALDVNDVLETFCVANHMCSVYFDLVGTVEVHLYRVVPYDTSLQPKVSTVVKENSGPPVLVGFRILKCGR